MTYRRLQTGAIHNVADADNGGIGLDERVPANRVTGMYFEGGGWMWDLKHCAAEGRVLSSTCSMSASRLQHSALQDLNVSRMLLRGCGCCTWWSMILFHFV